MKGVEFKKGGDDVVESIRRGSIVSRLLLIYHEVLGMLLRTTTYCNSTSYLLYCTVRLQLLMSTAVRKIVSTLKPAKVLSLYMIVVRFC